MTIPSFARIEYNGFVNQLIFPDGTKVIGCWPCSTDGEELQAIIEKARRKLYDDYFHYWMRVCPDQNPRTEEDFYRSLEKRRH
jgi:hypothetical protein